ncbi:MAG: hypothetical protein HQ541_15240, partial [Mariniphaga sp.]|nr:hypothetical protein [Mariniphaga sp.]
MMLSPFCYVNNANKIPKDGYLFQVPLFCKRSFNQKCKSYYDEIREKEGFSCCPYGFASLGIKKSSLVYIFTCLNLERVSNNKLIRKRITKKDSILKFSIENFKNRIEYYLGIETNFLEAKLEKEKYGELNSSINEKQDFFDNIFHELRKLNKQLKREIEALIKECNIGKISLEQINNKSQHIFAISQLITIRLNTFDFNQNPDLIIEGNQKDTIIFGKFKKIMHCLEYTAQLKNINLNINGKTTCKIKAFDIFELLPYLYIENAIKYSPDSHT